MDAPQFSMKDVQALVDRKVRSFNDNQGKPGSASIFDLLSEANPRDGPKKENRISIPPSRGNSSRGNRKRQLSSDNPTQSLCYDCGERGHYRGAPECKDRSAFNKRKRCAATPAMVDQGYIPRFFGGAPAARKTDEPSQPPRSYIGY